MGAGTVKFYFAERLSFYKNMFLLLFAKYMSQYVCTNPVSMVLIIILFSFIFCSLLSVFMIISFFFLYIQYLLIKLN